MRYGSLFAGIGGIDLGLDRAGMECAWQVEIDDYCRKVLTKHWPDVPKYGDIKECGAHNLEPVDLICGGFPCQDISVAGKGAGIEEGTRSGLWSEYHRIICELRPQYVLVENVSALLVRGLGRVLGDLAESGYNAEWDCIPAAAVGAPHRRDRIFIIAYDEDPFLADPAGEGLEERTGEEILGGGPLERFKRLRQGSGVLPDSGRFGSSAEGDGGIDRQPADKVEADLPRSGGQVSGEEGVLPDPRRELLERWRSSGAVNRSHLRDNAQWWAIEPELGRVAHGVPSRVDRLRGLGNAVVPQVAEFMGRLIVEHSGHETRKGE